MFGPVSHVFFSTLWNRQNEDFSARAQFCPQRSDFTSWHHFWNLQTKLPHPRTVLGLFPQWKVRLKFINRPKIGHARENPDSGSKLASLKSASRRLEHPQMDLATGNSAQPSAFDVGLIFGMIWGVSRTLLFCQHLKPKANAWIMRSWLGTLRSKVGGVQVR